MFHVKQPEADPLAEYLGLVERYHATLDLMSERGLKELTGHVADADAYAEVLGALSPAPGLVVDVGSGAGIPGLVIALRRQELDVVLVERRRKRAAFLDLAIGQLGLSNARVHAGDVRDLRGLAAGAVTWRAVGEPLAIYELTRHLHASEVTLVSRRGEGWRDERRRMAAVLQCEIAVVAERELRHRGTLVALRLPGGRACPSSG